ncbi:Clp protease N-terminal domain-containing protein [Rhodococcus sp. UNC363MFTsu5.1]|uniref:Clp protease N-terminal domain-containing protein n=1 Tax=Rhodococcus sp. UNC363MFTsu5.1 TaxID=1449069 RepID=UPI0004820EF8|nr:Clp protease N-terminal domain-containing protein [Rhodococcus sp. UNC363MFTsu5.1]
MFERFTTEARTAVIGAQAEARALKSPQIRTEHLLLGVVAAAEGTPLGHTLDDAGLTLDATRAAVAEARSGQALGAEDAEALRSIGIDLDAVRESLDAGFGENALDRAEPGERRGWFGRLVGGHVPFTAASKKALELSLREALARKDDHIGAEHILLGILRGDDAGAREVMATQLDPADLRRRILELLDRAA